MHMADYKHDHRPIVFLHLPKTGGQTIHHSVGGQVGGRFISPYRLQTQVKAGPTFPPEYRMHSGHLNWQSLEQVAGNPFSFMVLREPRERLGSFYFFMRAEARKARDTHGEEALSPVQRAILTSASAVFFSDDPHIRRMVNEGWSNLSLTYLATRTLRRQEPMTSLPLADLLVRAQENSRALSAIYRFGEFDKLEADLETVLGNRPGIVTKRANPGPLDPAVSRWGALLDELDSDAERQAMDRYVDEDEVLMQRIDFR